MSVFISEHLDYLEATKSATAKRLGVDNRPSESDLQNMRRIAKAIFEPLRANVANGPLAVTSFFRSKRVNAAVGGAYSSQHTCGQAMDIDADVHGGCTNRQVFDYIREHLAFDQLIWESGDDSSPAWVHVSLKESGNRGDVLRSVKVNGKMCYRPL